ncbi:hypothetical protein K2P97_10550 [bacterium]|nr:hypothetical protein [bacterium]
MKLVIMSLLTVFALGAQAVNLGDILPIIIGGGKPPRPAPYPGGPGHAPGQPAPYPGNPYPGNPYPGNPSYPPSQPYPGNPGYGNVTCRADDRGYEEHGGGHYSCGECLQHHGECIETCSSNMYECRVDGYDRYGRLVSFLGRGYDQWRAQDEALNACRYNYATNCYVNGCSNRQDVVSRRDCRRY